MANSPKLVCNALDRASPDAERLGHLQDTHALPKLLLHLAFGRAVYLRPTELHALGNGSLANHAPLILDDLQKPKTVGLQAAVEATRNLLPKLEADLKALTKAYNTKRKIGAR